MFQTFANIITTLRPKQWVKNLIFFLPLFFSGELLRNQFLFVALLAFISLCFLSSTIYILNDIIDIDRDRVHPQKKNRPISSGKISMSFAFFLLFFSLIITFVISLFILQAEYFVLLEIFYLAIMIAYSLGLKNIAIVDTIIITIGFVLRVVAGAVLLEIGLPAMLVVTIIGGALLISFGKRKAEISHLSHDKAILHRPALSVYPPGVLDAIITGVFAITFMAYILYCHEYSATAFTTIFVRFLPPSFKNPGWLLLTVPFAFYTLARYMILVYKGDKAEIPEEIWFKDKGLVFSIFIWFILLSVLIYSDQILKMITL